MFAIALSKEDAREILYPLMGCALIVLGASIKIPFYPVPFTLQTLALYLIALKQTPKQLLAAVGGYLLLASLGAPVFYFHANPLWWMGKCGGYLFAFPISCFFVAKMRPKIGDFYALSLGSLFLLALGSLWLIPFVGLSEALLKGFIFFIPCELVKIYAALVMTKRIKE